MGQFVRHLPRYLSGALCLGVFQYFMNRIDWASKNAVDAIFGPDDGRLWSIVVYIFGAAITAFILRVASRWLIFNAGRDVEYEMRGHLLTRLHQLGAAFYRKMSSGDIMSRATNDLLQVRLLYGFGILNLVNVVFAFVSALQVLLRIHVKLTLVSFVMLPFIVIATRAFSKGLFLSTRKNQESISALSERLQANLAGVRVVRSFALEKYEEQRFDVANRAYLEASLALARLRGLMGPVAGTASALGILAFFGYGGQLLLAGVAQGGISQGDFFAFWLALGRMTWPIIALGFSVAIIQRGRAGFTRLQEILEAEPEVKDGKLAAPESMRGALRASSLSFAYGDRKVLDDVSFEIPAGGSLAIVGRTGSGKSTLATLLARLLPTPPGTVFVDSYDVCDLPVVTTRANIGYAQQDAFLFSTTVARNVGFSLDAPEPSQELIEHAAREAQVYDEIMALPEQFDTVVGERGVQLSGGQKQRIALARALVREPKILVLDDPLSAVDAKTEAAILEAIDRQKKARTLVLVTHRVAAASRCDRIVVLDQGRIVEQGTHDELVSAGGIYGIFAAEQSAQRELEAFEAEVVS